MSTLNAARHLAALGLTLMIAAFAAPAFASPYTVAGIEIDAEAGTSFDAQRTALAQGQTRAARILIERLTLAEDRMEAQLPALDADTAARLIAGLQISDEQRSATRYRARITVDFDPREVRNYLTGLQIPFVESQAEPVLVVPVMDGQGGAQIFGGPWYDAWLDGGYANSLTPMIALGSRRGLDGGPVGRGIISTSQALSLDARALRELAEAYGVDSVAVIQVRSSSGGVRAAGDLLRFNGGGDGPEIESIPSQIVSGYADAARAIVREREEAWKRQAVVRGGESAQLEITLLFNSLREWRALQSAVAGASLIENARLDALSRTGAAMTITHRGAREQVRSELAARGAEFSEESEFGWTVRPR
ncbi:MAG: DUF2066 domain-containing protein [Oceanicaulis sp.]